MTGFPDGITTEHMPRQQRWGRILAWGILVLLGAFLLFAMSGAFGGQPSPTRSVDSDSAAVEVTVPETLRNGEFFEMRVRIAAKQAIAKPVVAVTSAYWRNLTINTMIPAPSEEGFEDGSLAFTYGSMEAGDTLEIKIDGQVNPARTGSSAGIVTLREDKSPLASVPVSLKVFP